MMCVLQRVAHAQVVVGGETVGQVGLGWLALVGAAQGDTTADGAWLVDKVAGLRAFADEAGKMNKALADVGGGVLVVSQFTLLANFAKGRRPSFENALEPTAASTLVDEVVAGLKAKGLPVETGRFGADMKVTLMNDGPVTFILDSKSRG